MGKSLLRLLIVFVITVAIVFGAITIFNAPDPRLKAYNTVTNSAVYKNALVDVENYKTLNQLIEHDGVGSGASAKSMQTYQISRFEKVLLSITEYYLGRLLLVNNVDVINNIEPLLNKALEAQKKVQRRYTVLTDYISSAGRTDVEAERIVVKLNNEYANYLIEYYNVVVELENYMRSAVDNGRNQKTIKNTIVEALVDFSERVVVLNLTGTEKNFTTLEGRVNYLYGIYDKFLVLMTSSVSTGENTSIDALKFVEYYSLFNYKTDFFDSYLTFSSYVNNANNFSDVNQQNYAKSIYNYLISASSY